MASTEQNGSTEQTPRLSLSKRFEHRIEWAFTRFLIGMCSIIPLGALRRMGAGLGWFAYRVVKLRRRVVVDNISRSFADMPAEEVDAVALESYQQYGMAFMEFGAFHSLTQKKLFDMVDIEGIENLDKALDHGKGAILFTGHFGNWELLGAVIAQSGYPLHVTDTNHSNKHSHELISGLRIKQKMKIISVREPFSHFNDLLSSNCLVAYLAVQDARNHGVFVDFLGRPASTVRGPAIFAIRNDCPVVATFMIRDGYDRHKAVFEEPIWPDPNLTGREAVRDLTQRFTQVLEKYVRAYPGHYFWMHRRWKTAPPVRPGE